MNAKMGAKCPSQPQGQMTRSKYCRRGKIGSLGVEGVFEYISMLTS